MLSSLSQTVVQLLQEVHEGNRVWATLERTYTAGEMIRLIQADAAEGQQYVLDTLRLCRDIIANSGEGRPPELEIDDAIN